MASLAEITGEVSKRSNSTEFTATQGVQLFNTPDVAKTADMSGDVDRLLGNVQTFAKTMYSLGEDAMTQVAIDHRIKYAEAKNRILNNTDRDLNNGDVFRTPEEQKLELTAYVQELNNSVKEQINGNEISQSIYDKSFTSQIKEDYVSTIGKLHTISMQKALQEKELYYKQNLDYDWKNYSVEEAVKLNKLQINAGIKDNNTIKQEVLSAKLKGITNDIKVNENTSYFDNNGNPTTELFKVFKGDYRLYAEPKIYDAMTEEQKQYYINPNTSELEDILIAKEVTNSISMLQVESVDVSRRKQVERDTKFINETLPLSWTNQQEFLKVAKKIRSGEYKDISARVLESILGQEDAIHRANGVKTPTDKYNESNGTKFKTDNGKKFVAVASNSVELYGEQLGGKVFKLSRFNTINEIDTFVSTTISTIESTEKNPATATNKIDKLRKDATIFKGVWNAVKNNIPVSKLTGDVKSQTISIHNDNAIESYNVGNYAVAGKSISMLSSVPTDIKNDINELMSSNGADTVREGVDKLIKLNTYGSNVIKKDGTLNAYLTAIKLSTVNKVIDYNKLTTAISLSKDTAKDSVSYGYIKAVGGRNLDNADYTEILLNAKIKYGTTALSKSQVTSAYEEHMKKFTTEIYGVTVTNKAQKIKHNNLPYSIDDNDIEHMLYFTNATLIDKSYSYKGKKLKDVIKGLNIHSDGSATINVDGSMQLEFSKDAVINMIKSGQALNRTLKQQQYSEVQKQKEKQQLPKVTQATKKTTPTKINIRGNDFLKDKPTELIKVK